MPHELMQVALASARERVVLKWPLRAQPLLESAKTVASVRWQDGPLRSIFDGHQTGMSEK